MAIGDTVASSPPKVTNVFTTTVGGTPSPLSWGKGHYPPAKGGRKINDATAYEILGPIFGKYWKKAAAIARAESDGDTHARGVNDDGSVDRGWFQINSRWHPEVTDAVAYNARGSALAAFAISKGGTDWTPWATNSIADPNSIHLPNADDAGLFGIGRGEGADTKVAKALPAIGDFLAKIMDGTFWLHVLLVLAGGALLVFGIVQVGKQYGVSMPMPMPIP